MDLGDRVLIACICIGILGITFCNRQLDNKTEKLRGEKELRCTEYTELEKVKHKILYGLPAYDSAELKVNGVEYEYTYRVGDEKYQEIIYVEEIIDWKKITAIKEGELKDIKVRYNPEKPEESLLEYRKSS